jgi:integrase
MQAFCSWLAQNGRTQRTAEVYAAMVEFGQKRGNVLLAVRKARTRGSLAVAAAALRAWGDWTGNEGLARQVARIVRSRKVKATIVSYITDQERATLMEQARKIEEPYRSAMTVLIGSGLRLGTVLDLSRPQVEAGCTERVPIVGSRKVVIGLWLPSPEVREAFCALTQFGTWARLQDLFGRDYPHAYQQIRVLLHHLCRKAGIRQVKPSELSQPNNPDQEDLDRNAIGA